METLRTYYWNSRKVDIARHIKNKLFYPNNMSFRYGNAGDIFNVDLLKYLYEDITIKNDNESGNRLLLVGSIMNIVKEGDIINGIGWKGNDFSDKQELIEKALVYGVRGPLTLDLFKRYGADLSNLKFQFDPGLLVKEVYNVDLSKSSEKNVLFIPHYKDLWQYKTYPKGLKLVNIDNKPKTILKEILNAKVVYASSLHGIIFAHALNKPCVFVAPQTEEPIFKYEDYFLSMGLELPKIVKSIHGISYAKDQETLPSKKFTIKDFWFPNKTQLKQRGVLL
jgi:hypothetical protein